MPVRFLAVLVLYCFSLPAFAETVVPSERVTNGVTIRSGESSNTAPIGVLRPGENLPWVSDHGRWREVRITADQTGWVSKSWTRRISDTPLADNILAARQVDELRIHYLPVGAGTCTVVECPGANAPPMLIDCGSTGGRGSNDLNEASAVAAIDAILANHTVQPNLVLSHGDEDHYSYLDEVLNHVQVSHIWMGGAPEDYSTAFRAILGTQDTNGATLHQRLAANFHNNQFELGNELSCGEASTFILTVNSGGSKNANSLVLSIDYRDFSAVFTGDAEASTERAAIANYGGAVKTTVLSGSHHGADTQGSNGSAKDPGGPRSGWPLATAPEVMVYSHGQKFGHPRCTITSNYHSSLATVPTHPVHCGDSTSDNMPAPDQTARAEYSTEVSGTVTVTTDGTSPLSIQCSEDAGCATEVSF